MKENMPINLKNPQSIIIDKVQIEKIEIFPDSKSIILHYSKGYLENNEFVAKSSDKIEVPNAEIPLELYSSVKDFLYDLLDSNL